MSNITKFTPEEINLLKSTICPAGTTDAELKVFLAVCERKKLDPFQRQIYLTKRWDKALGKEKMTIITSIDGFRAIAARSGSYAGCDDAVFDSEKSPQKATVTVYRIVQGQRCSWSASARWDQYCPPKGSDFMWNKMPHVMLGKVAEALALRKAFPEDLSGIYTDDEIAQAEQREEKQHAKTKIIEEPKTEKRQAKGVKEQIEEIGDEYDEIQEWRDHIRDLFLARSSSPFYGNPKEAAQFAKDEVGKNLGDMNAVEMEELLSRFYRKYPELEDKAL